MDTVECCSNHIRIPERVGKYKVIKQLGRGNFAVVVLGYDEKRDKYVAIKILDRLEIVKSGILTYVENELRISSRLDHPNIARVYQIIYEEDIIMIVMEYLPNGDLQKVLMKNVIFTYTQQVKIVAGILSGLQYLHQRKIAHRDIKPENILFDEDFNPKFIDFGLSRETTSAQTTFCGTTIYLAPEIILCDHYDPFKADIWSVGLTIHMLTTLTFPFKYVNEAHYLKDMKNGTLVFHNLAHGVLGDVIDMCVVQDPHSRASIDQIAGYLNVFDHGNTKYSQSQVDKKLPAITTPKLNLRKSTPLVVCKSTKCRQSFKYAKPMVGSPIRA